MPRIILSSKSKQKEAIFLQSWIEPTVRTHWNSAGNSQAAQLPINNIIPRLSLQDLTHPQMSPAILQNTFHFTKIAKFYRVDGYRVFASIRDDSHQLLSSV